MNHRDDDPETNPEEPVWLLLDRYLAGECSAGEASLVEQWAASPRNARILQDVRRVWLEAAAPVPAIDEEAELMRLQARLAGAIVPPPRLLKTVPQQRSPRWKSYGVLAAAAAIVIAVALWRTVGVGRAAPTTPAARQYATARAQRAEVLLDDGTRVWLSVDSHLETAAGYGVRARDVTLTGEAFFVVQHDAARPFRVHTRHGVTQVLGTEFGVRAYPEDAVSAVGVSTGRVSLRGTAPDASLAGDAVRLQPGDVGRVDGDGRITVEKGVDVAAIYGWRAGRLAFDGAPLSAVVPQLERWYDLEIHVGDTSLARTPVTASFANATADQALTIIAGTLDVRCSRDGRVVQLSNDVAKDAPSCASSRGTNHTSPVPSNPHAR